MKEEGEGKGRVREERREKEENCGSKRVPMLSFPIRDTGKI